MLGAAVCLPGPALGAVRPNWEHFCKAPAESNGR